ncbi:hypothetical protein L7F22_017080 [Adiantum nelumboides]|nr:hypothetical protein [Adiantum nelumboides]
MRPACRRIVGPHQPGDAKCVPIFTDLQMAMAPVHVAHAKGGPASAHQLVRQWRQRPVAACGKVAEGENGGSRGFDEKDAFVGGVHASDREGQDGQVRVANPFAACGVVAAPVAGDEERGQRIALSICGYGLLQQSSAPLLADCHGIDGVMQRQ